MSPLLLLKELLQIIFFSFSLQCWSGIMVSKTLYLCSFISFRATLFCCCQLCLNFKLNNTYDLPNLKKYTKYEPKQISKISNFFWLPIIPKNLSCWTRWLFLERQHCWDSGRQKGIWFYNLHLELFFSAKGAIFRVKESSMYLYGILRIRSPTSTQQMEQRLVNEERFSRRNSLTTGKLSLTATTICMFYSFKKNRWITSLVKLWERSNLP